MTTNTMYVLVKIGWQYNDEYYERPDAVGPSGEPVTVYTSKENAVKACRTLNAVTQFSGPTDSDGVPVQWYEVAEVKCI